MLGIVGNPPHILITTIGNPHYWTPEVRTTPLLPKQNEEPALPFPSRGTFLISTPACWLKSGQYPGICFAIGLVPSAIFDIGTVFPESIACFPRHINSWLLTARAWPRINQAPRKGQKPIHFWDNTESLQAFLSINLHLATPSFIDAGILTAPAFAYKLSVAWENLPYSSTTSCNIVCHR